MFDEILEGLRYIWDLTKAREYKGPARIGEVRHWQGGYYKKHGERDWRPVPGPDGKMPPEDMTHHMARHTPQERDHGRARDEKVKLLNDMAHHGEAAAERRHHGRMHRVVDAIRDPDKAVRRARAFHEAGHPEMAKKYFAQALELAGTAPGMNTMDEMAAVAGKTPDGTATREALAHADDQAKKLGLGTKHRQKVQEGLRAQIDAHKKPAVPAAAMQSQLGAAAHSAPPEKPEPATAQTAPRQHAQAGTHIQRAEDEKQKVKADIDAMGDKRAERHHLERMQQLAAGMSHASDAMRHAAAFRLMGAKGAAKVFQDRAAALGGGHGGAPKARRVGVAQNVAAQAAQANIAAAVRGNRAKRQASLAAPVPVSVPPAQAAPRAPAPRPEPQASPVTSPQVTPPSGTSKDKAPLAGPHPPEFLGKSHQLESGITDSVGVSTWRVKEKQSVNVTFFNKLENGLSVVFKPHKMGLDPRSPDMGRGAFYNWKIRETEREKAAYEFDRVLGMGMVPPVTVRTDVIPADVMRGVVSSYKGRKAAKAAGYTGGDFKTKGSAMYLVDDVETWADHAYSGKDYANLPKNTQFDLQKLACFDFITGTTDRHQYNWLVDKQDNLIAIDHGLCFPWTEDPSQVNPLAKFRSLPFNTLRDSSVSIDKKIIDHLKTLKKEQVIGALAAHGLKKEGEHCWMRLQALVKAGNFDYDPRDEASWYRPEVLNG